MSYGEGRRERESFKNRKKKKKIRKGITYGASPQRKPEAGTSSQHSLEVV